MSSGVTRNSETQSNPMRALYPKLMAPEPPPLFHSLLQHLTWRPTWSADQPALLAIARRPSPRPYVHYMFHVIFPSNFEKRDYLAVHWPQLYSGWYYFFALAFVFAVNFPVSSDKRPQRICVCLRVRSNLLYEISMVCLGWLGWRSRDRRTERSWDDYRAKNSERAALHRTHLR